MACRRLSWVPGLELAMVGAAGRAGLGLLSPLALMLPPPLFPRLILESLVCSWKRRELGPRAQEPLSQASLPQTHHESHPRARGPICTSFLFSHFIFTGQGQWMEKRGWFSAEGGRTQEDTLGCHIAGPAMYSLDRVPFLSKPQFLQLSNGVSIPTPRGCCELPFPGRSPKAGALERRFHLPTLGEPCVQF